MLAAKEKQLFKIFISGQLKLFHFFGLHWHLDGSDNLQHTAGKYCEYIKAYTVELCKSLPIFDDIAAVSFPVIFKPLNNELKLFLLMSLLWLEVTVEGIELGESTDALAISISDAYSENKQFLCCGCFV